MVRVVQVAVVSRTDAQRGVLMTVVRMPVLESGLDGQRARRSQAVLENHKVRMAQMVMKG